VRLILNSVVLSLALALIGCGAVQTNNEDPCNGQPNATCEMLHDSSGTSVCGLSLKRSLLDSPDHGPRVTIDDYACEAICDPKAPRCADGLECRSAQGYSCNGGACVDGFVGFDSCQLPETK